jgi:outer membrane protein assembly factor BamD (BamD/ComL family)
MFKNKIALTRSIIFIIILSLIGLVVYLLIFSDGLMKANNVKNQLLGYKDAGELLIAGHDFYVEEKFAESRAAFKMIMDDHELSKEVREAALMYAFTYAAEKKYSKASSELEKFYKKYPMSDSDKEFILLIIETIKQEKIPERWDCCQVGSFGGFYVYGICYYSQAIESSMTGNTPDCKKYRKPWSME